MSITQQRYGAVTVERHRECQAQGVHLHVWYRGRDVTTQCCFADDTNEGMAELYLLNADGNKYRDPNTNHVAKEIVYGITIVAGEPLI